MFNVGIVDAQNLKAYLNGELAEGSYIGDAFAGTFVSFVINPHSGQYTVISKA